jgi:hypothetical protein
MGVDYVVMGVLKKSLQKQQIAGEKCALAWFISPHGFGHAARASALVAACSSRRRGLHHHIFTTVPRGFFSDSLPGVSFDYHRLECDVGMVQATAFVEDVDGTIRALERLPVDHGPEFERVVDHIAATDCRLVVSDIAPQGLAVANRLGLPGVLVENFTWDWIYQAYRDPRLNGFGGRLAEIFRSATLRIQAAPVCEPAENGRTVAPVSRAPRRTRTEVRESLGIPAEHRVVLLSVGGLHVSDFEGCDFRPPTATTLVVPGAVDRVRSNGTVIWIPIMGGPYHPDLVAASDLVIAKLGYSTVAEVYQAKTAFAYLSRQRFPESPVLEAFVRQNIPSEVLPEDWFGDPSAAENLEVLLDGPRPTGARPNGADEAAKLILSFL